MDAIDFCKEFDLGNEVTVVVRWGTRMSAALQAHFDTLDAQPGGSHAEQKHWQIALYAAGKQIQRLYKATGNLHVAQDKMLVMDFDWSKSLYVVRREVFTIYNVTRFSIEYWIDSQ